MPEHSRSPARLDRDAVLDALQDQIDDLTAAVGAQQHRLDRQEHLIRQLARRVGLPTPPRPGD